MDFNYFSTKGYTGFPCNHRQWNHDGHCSFIHGYSRSFYFTFVAENLNENCFVMDFSKLRGLKEHLSYMYDHTTLICEDDPELGIFKKLHEKKIIDMRIVKNCSMESTAEYLFHFADNFVKNMTNSRVFCHKVEARENEYNSAIYCPYSSNDRNA